MGSLRSGLLPRERVLLSLGHRDADRSAFSWSFGPQPPARAALDQHLARWGLDYPTLYERTSDIRRFDARYVGPRLPVSGYLAHWGIGLKSVSYGTGAYDEFDIQPLAHAQTVEHIERHPWPKPDHFDCAGVWQEVRRVDPGHRYARVLWGGNPMEILSWMVGLENLMVLLVTEPQVIHAGMERIASFFEQIMRRTLEAAPAGSFDAVFCADDLGTQQGPMISREMYRELIMPYHVRLYRLAHEHVPYTIHHSDGSVFALLDDLIEAGVDCLEAVQVECRDMAPEKLKAAAGSRLAFQGAVSVQQMLPYQDAVGVREEVRRLKSILGRGGGYICAPSHAIQAGTPPENVVAMVEEACETTIDQIARPR